MKNGMLLVIRIIMIAVLAFITAFAVMRGLEKSRREGPYGRMNMDNQQSTLSISVLGKDGTVEQMELEEYIARVVLGEVSTGYHPEALKAQAVAARTYTLYCVLSLSKHAEGAVCKDHRCCQAYCDPDGYLRNGGTQQGLEKVRRAVQDTRGEVLYYNNELICATYFACSAGRTENAEDVWGEKYPYLKAVFSSEENSGCDEQKIELSASELQHCLGVQLAGKPEQWFGFKLDTVGGGVALIRIGGNLYTGVELRKLLNLRSTIFDITVKKESVIIQSRGYGHRVGMSQHGANAMAEAGCGYRSILLHYYTGVTLKPYES